MRTPTTAERRGPGISQAAHPAQRPAEPDHPMVVEGDVVPGDTVFMLRCMLEDMLGAGVRPDEIRRMMKHPEYRALYAARETLGERVAEQLLTDVEQRVVTLRVRIQEVPSHKKDVTLTVDGRPLGLAPPEEL